MAPAVPDPKKIKAFKSEAAFDAWMRRNHSRETEIWLRIFKTGSGKPTVTNAQALDVALCWGWIDGIRKALDDESFLQRYSPRRARSIWSQINRDHVRRLTEAGRMQPLGRGVRANAQRLSGLHSRRSPRRDRGQSARGEDVQHARPTEPFRARVPHEQHEDARWARAQDCIARGDARSG
jgi:hypothetical protein